MEKIYEVELIRRGYIRVRADNKDDAKRAALSNVSVHSDIDWDDSLEIASVGKPND